MIPYSIIIPTHNSSKLIGKLLESIPKNNNYEVLIVDDHSTKDELRATRKIVESFNIGNIKFLVNTGVNSAGAARNIGLAEARGRWVVFADSDDYFTDDIDLIFKKYSNSEADMIFFGIDGNAVTNRARNLNKLVDSKKPTLVKYNHAVPWGKIIRKSIIDDNNVQFSETIVCNDELFSTKVGYFSENIIFDNTLGYYSFEREDSLTTQHHDISKQDIRMGEVLKKYTFLSKNLGKEETLRLKLSIFANIKKAVFAGGPVYALRWYKRIFAVNGRLNIMPTIIRKYLK